MIKEKNEVEDIDNSQNQPQNYALFLRIRPKCLTLPLEFIRF